MATFVLLSGKLVNVDYVERVECTAGKISRLTLKEVNKKAEEDDGSEKYVFYLRSGVEMVTSYLDFLEFQKVCKIA